MRRVTTRWFVPALLGVLLATPGASCAQIVYDVSSRPVTIWSEGTRMAGTLWWPEDTAPDAKLPAILLVHGWGGEREHLDATYAPKFADAGFVVLSFDYRGWGGSDGKLVAQEKLPAAPEAEDGKAVTGPVVEVRAQVVREVVDPYDQLEDVRNALAWLLAEPMVDPERLGIWGTSYGGGHVIVMAATEPRIRAVVSQVGSQGAEKPEPFVAHGQLRAAQKARGEIDPVPQAIDVAPGLRGTPDVAKMIRYRPLTFAPAVRVPTLFIDMEGEELFDRTRNGKAAFEIVQANAPARYETFEGSHYDVYTRRYFAASDLASDWFREHLQGGSGSGTAD